MTKFAMIFPGQGSQKVGMLAELAESFPIITQTFEEASERIKIDLWKLASEGPIEELNKTYYTQPTLLAASIAVWRLWQQQVEIRPDAVAGHSLGEYSALVAAEVIGFSDAIELVRDRGLFMQNAVPEGVGAMAAILGLSDDVVEKICQVTSSDNSHVAPVNYNSAGQIVIAGHKLAVEQAANQCKEAGAKRAMLLPVSVPSHSALMKPAAQKLSEKLESITLREPKIELINNVDVKVERDPTAIKQALVRQLYCPVRWCELVTQIEQAGIHHFFEIGPGNVLTGLVKRITKDSINIAVNDKNSLEKAFESLKVES